MKAIRCLSLITAALLFAGCTETPPSNKPKGDPAKPGATAEPAKPADPVTAGELEAKIKTNLAKLNDDDRDAVKIQKFCAVQEKSLLGGMGVPVKITLKDKEDNEVSAWLCCKGCETEARKNAVKTIARVTELNIQGTLATLSPEDRKAAEAQKFCAKENDTRLGSMDAPFKVMVKDKDGKEHPVFFCCGGCKKIIDQIGPEKTLQIVEELKKKNAAPAAKQ
jgi:hypothetical protein